MLLSLWVSVSFAESEVNHVNSRLFVANSSQKIIRFHVSMEEVLSVHEFDSCDHLLSQQTNGFQRKAAVAELKQLLKRSAKQLHDHSFVVALNAVPVYIGYSIYNFS